MPRNGFFGNSNFLLQLLPALRATQSIGTSAPTFADWLADFPAVQIENAPGKPAG